MNNTTKLTATVLAAAMLAACAGCADQTWSYRKGDVSLSTGTYIYNLLNSYYEAHDLIESPDEVDDKDILTTKVTGSDSDAQTKTVEQYALDEADETSKRMVAVEALFNEYGLELDETEDEAAQGYADQVWQTAKKTLEGYGISQESFNYAYAEYSVKFGQVFEYVYGENGDKYLSDDDLTKSFEENYTPYAFFSVSMAETDEDGNSVAKSDDEFKKTEKDLNGYADMLNKQNKDYKETVKKYIADYELTYDPTYSGALKNDDDSSSFDESVVKAVKELDEGKATVVKTGEDATAMYYLVYRPKYADISDYLKTDATSTTPASDGDEVYVYDLKSGYTRYTLIDELKGDEFEDFLDDYAAGLGIEKNENAIKGYKVSKFITESDEEEE